VDMPRNGTVRALAAQPHRGSHPSSRRGGPSFVDRFATTRRTTPVLVALACLAGAAIPWVQLRIVAVGVAASVAFVAVVVRPALAGYLLIGVTPLVAGIDRGSILPFLRPSEGLLLLAAGGVLTRVLVDPDHGLVLRSPARTVDRSILVLALASSVLPLLWLMVRGGTPAADDLLYSLNIWKYYGAYLVVRVSIRSEEEIRTCLWIAMASASVVAVVGILQSLHLLGVTRLLARYYAPYGNVQAVLNHRGGSTLALPIAVADLMTFNVGIALGLLARRSAHRELLAGLILLFVAGAVAAGEFSGFIALGVGLAAVAVVTRRVRPLAGLAPGLVAVAYALRPVIDRRLQGFQMESGLPVSWVGRLHNLQGYFLPDLLSHGNFLLGVRPAARVATATMATGYIWIESGYLSLLWTGGLPLLVAFLYFLWTNVRRNLALARSYDDARGVAALAVVGALAVIAPLMLIDPHLTYRGSADLLFALLALASAGGMGLRSDRHDKELPHA
jgi:hypothetical protein